MKKGFTLIELLAVITILGILTIFLVPSMIKVSNDSKQRLYNSKVEKIEASAKEWGYDNIDDIGTDTTITIQNLINKKYLRGDSNNKEVLESPITKGSMNNCVIEVKYNDNKVIASLKTTGENCGGLK